MNRLRRKWARIKKHIQYVRSAITDIRQAAEQIRSGHLIGNRQTPVISWWAMRPKWSRKDWYWSHVGTDGDMEQRPEGLYMPAQLHLSYIYWKGGYFQLAYVIHDAWLGGPSEEKAKRFHECLTP